MRYRDFRFILLDALGAVLALYASFLLRFEFYIPLNFLLVLKGWILAFSIIQMVTFMLSGLYSRMWRYTSLFDLYAIMSAVVTSSGLSFIYILFTSGSSGYPRSTLLLYFIFNSIFVVGLRLCVRIYYSHYHQDSVLKNRTPKKTLLLIGAGKTGEKIAKEIRTTSRNEYTLAGFVDDNTEKHGALLHGRKIFCSVQELLSLKIHYDEILITTPSATGDQMRKIVEVCKKTGKRYRTLPSLPELINNEVSLARIRDVSYADLLGREEVVLDMNSIENLLMGKRILITGAGGSIGSELVKQCMSFNPSEIICVDFNEEKIFQLEQLYSKGNLKTILKTVLASINNKMECEKIFMENRPQIVFHAAAYKHVPIQELHPWNAVNTNLVGTLNMTLLSDKYNTEKFVLVSTDKAVNPANIMGATKRAAEKLIQSFNSESRTKFMAVRFGNVLGSSGSAIPTFQKQINDGGPLTITHPEMTRYFMSIQEASQLILQCCSFGRDGEIFLLEMGRPIKILQMAKDLIRLSGLEPDVDIPIVFTGLRPGEKLYEELQLHNEKKVKTNHKKIMILKESSTREPWRLFLEQISALKSAADTLDKEKIQYLLKQILPTFSPIDFSSDIQKRKISYPIKVEA